MKISILFIFTFILLSCKMQKSKQTQKTVFVKDTFNFGLINKKDTFSDVAFYRNFSNMEIKILKIENACGCTSASLKDSIVNVNDSLPIAFTYIPFKNKDSGDIIKFITVRTNSDIPFSNIIVKGGVN